MKIIGAQILQYFNNKASIVQSEFNLDFVGFFARKSTIELLKFFTCYVANENHKDTNLNNKLQILEHTQTNSNVCILRRDNKFVCIICDKEYPIKVLAKLVLEIFAENMNLHHVVYECNDPTKIDKIMETQAKIDKTIEVLHDTINGIIERGEKIDKLVKQSDELSEATKMFYDKTKKLNRCCVIL